LKIYSKAEEGEEDKVVGDDDALEDDPGADVDLGTLCFTIYMLYQKKHVSINHSILTLLCVPSFLVIDLYMARLDDLANRRPLLISSVLLRQNPHNVREWHKRVALFKDDPEKTIMTYTDAVMTVDPWKATGKPHSLWVAFARYYEDNDDIENARVIFDRATRVPYKSIEDLANLWCEFAEMELRHNNSTAAISVLKKATTVPRHRSRWTPLTGSAADQLISVQEKVYKSTKLWSFYADLEENFGTLESTKAVYEQMIHIKVATPKVIINYATYLEVFVSVFPIYHCYTLYNADDLVLTWNEIVGIGK
jgi:pre-mRNA-splicing factor SYF1